MEATKLVVEYLISGILITLALVLLTLTLFPTELTSFLQLLDKAKDTLSAVELILAIALTAIAYAAGIIVEYVGTAAFTRVLDWIKRRRLKPYIRINAALFAGDPLLAQFTSDALAEADPDRLSRVVGEMRYYVMADDQSLYAGIALQISSLRLIRVTFFVGLLVCISLIIHLSRSYSAPLSFALCLSIGLTAVSLAATLSRLSRYCQCIEKAYKILALTRSETSNRKAEGARGRECIVVPIRRLSHGRQAGRPIRPRYPTS